LDDATVAFRLPDARVTTAVEKAQLAVEQGEFVAIVGPTERKIDELNIVPPGPSRRRVGRIFDRPLRD